MKQNAIGEAMPVELSEHRDRNRKMIAEVEEKLRASEQQVEEYRRELRRLDKVERALDELQKTLNTGEESGAEEPEPVMNGGQKAGTLSGIRYKNGKPSVAQQILNYLERNDVPVKFGMLKGAIDGSGTAVSAALTSLQSRKLIRKSGKPRQFVYSLRA